METIDMKSLDVSRENFENFCDRYARKEGYQKPFNELPSDISNELFTGVILCYAARKLPIGTDFVADFGKGNRLTCQKLGQYEISIYTRDLADMAGMDTDSEEYKTILSQCQQRYRKIPDDQWWHHPLSEVSEINGEEVLNMYAVFELSINSVRGIEKTNALGKEKYRQIIINAVYTANPQINLTPLLERAVAGYEADTKSAPRNPFKLVVFKTFP